MHVQPRTAHNHMHLAQLARGVARGVAPGARFLRTAAVRSKNSKAPEGSLADPFPLPFSPELDPAKNIDLVSRSQRVEGVSVEPRVPGRTNEDRKTKLARLQYQCRKRGTLEADLIISTWAREELPTLSDAELDELDYLLDEPDWDIFYWCTERKPVPEQWRESFTTPGRLGYRLVNHTRNDKRVVRRFPSLDSNIQSPA